MRYGSFDGLRAYAAIGILLMHYLFGYGVLFPDFKLELINAMPLLYDEIIPFLTWFVFMFFIVSSFSMCCGYFQRFQLKEIVDSCGNAMELSSFDTESFYSKRYLRIWPFFALLVLIDFVMKPSVSEFYQAFADLTLAFNLLPNPDIEVIGVGWFLGLVFVFYMIFPWFVFLLKNKVRAWFAMGVAIVFHIILLKYFLTLDFCTQSQINNFRHNFVYSFPFFMAGGLLFLYREWFRQRDTTFRLILLLFSFIATCIQFTLLTPEPDGKNIFWIGIVFILWVMYAMVDSEDNRSFKLLDNKIVKFLSDISMEIYLCHMVMFRIVEKIHLERFIENPHLLYWIWCFLGFALAIIFSWSVKKFLFPKIGNLLNNAFGQFGLLR